MGNSNFPAGSFRCGGEYLHVSERINGQPVWKQRGSHFRTQREMRDIYTVTGITAVPRVIKAKGIGLYFC